MKTEAEDSFIRGHVVSGTKQAQLWLAKYNDEYSKKLGIQIYPGSLNVLLEKEFFLLESPSSAKTIRMSQSEYGGERDILMRPCLVFERPAYIWRTENAEKGLIDGFDFRLVELISDIHFLSTFKITIGAQIEIEVL